MIPKIIHFCWFGHNPQPPLVQSCIESWHRVMPDFEIKLWDENNVPITDYPFMRDAYKMKKFAFVSDYARYWILKNYGGFCLDCDVEMLKSLDDLKFNKVIFAFGKHVKKNVFFVSPGLIMAAEKNNKTINEILSVYDSLNFIMPNGSPNLKCSSPRILTKFLLDNKGLVIKDECQMLQDDIKILSSDYFDPINPRSLRGVKLDMTSNTHGIHRGAASWVPLKKKIGKAISIILRDLVGDNIIDKIRGKEQQT